MESLETRGITLATTIAGLAAGTTTTVTIANDVQFSIKGKGYKKTAASNIAAPTTDAVTGSAFLPIAASKGCVFAVGLNAALALKVVQGSIEDLDPAATGGSTATFLKAPQFPSTLPDDFCPIGYIVTKVGASGSAWTFSGSNLAGPPSNVLHTFVDCFQLPSRPQVS